MGWRSVASRIFRLRPPQTIITPDGQAKKLNDTLGVRVPEGTSMSVRTRHGALRDVQVHHPDGIVSRAVADPANPDRWTVAVTRPDDDDGVTQRVVGSDLSKDEVVADHDWARRPEKAFEAGREPTAGALDAVHRADEQDPPGRLPALLGLDADVAGVVLNELPEPAPERDDVPPPAPSL
jgi:hypothetical protein